MKTFRHASLIVATSTLVACGGQPTLRSYDLSPRARLQGTAGPAATPATTLTSFPDAAPPTKKSTSKVETVIFANGVQLVVQEAKGMPLVSVTVSSGIALPPDVAELRSESLGSSTTQRDSNEIWTALNYIGARYEANSSYSDSYLSLSVLSNILQQGIRNAIELSLSATFERDNIAKERIALKKTAAADLDLDTTAHMAMRHLLYPLEHPYWFSGTDIAKRAADVPTERIVAMQKEVHDSAPLVIAVVGATNMAQVRPIVEPLVSKLPKRAALPALVGDAPPLKRSVVVIDKKDSTQAYVLVGGVGVHGNHADYPGLRMAVSHMSERARFHMRLEHGASYGGGATFGWYRGPGPIFIGGQVEVSSVGENVQSILTELNAMTKAPLGEGDASNASERLREETAYLRTTNLSNSQWLASLTILGRHIDDKLATASAEDVRRAAATYLPADRVPIVVVGDQEKILPQLRALKIGDVKVETAP